MEATRVELGAIVEWVVAAGCVVVILGAGSIVRRELQTVTAATPLTAHQAEAVPSAPAGVPERAVSVPVLLLPGGGEVRVGQPLSAADRILAAEDRHAETIERGPTGDRIIRDYDRGGTRFVLVFEPLQPNAEPRIAAIYLR